MKRRRALSTVVGMVFAIIALTTTVVYISYSMNLLGSYNQSVLSANQQLTNVDKEKFTISNVLISGGKLNITVANTGTLPVSITKLWARNTSAVSTDWTHSYPITTGNLVSPGGTIANIGQSIGLSYNPLYSYNIKLVTSRGNTQQFSLNSASAAPLNIQLLAIPATVDTGFQSELVMIVTNNGSSTLANVTPTALPAPTGSGSAYCSASSVSPAMYNTLPPGSTAIFKWAVTINSGASQGQTCTYTLSPPIQNGYSGQSVSATITVNIVTFTQTNLAANTGTLTINYTTWQYTLGSGWQTSYSLQHGSSAGFSIKLTNNDPSRTFYLSNKTSIVFIEFKVGTQSSTTASSYILTNVTSTAAYTKYTCAGAPTDDYCINLIPGQTINLSIGGNAVAGGTSGLSAVPNAAGPTTSFLLLYGKFDTSRGGNALPYAQDIPYIAIFLT